MSTRTSGFFRFHTWRFAKPWVSDYVGVGVHTESSKAGSPAFGRNFTASYLFSGIGFGLMFSPALVMVNTYFDKRRSLASGLALAGGSMGTLLIPQLLAVLIREFAAKGALLVYAGLMMHVIFGAALLRPTTYYTRSKPSRFGSRNEEKLVQSNEQKKHSLNANGANKSLGGEGDGGEMFWDESATKRIRSGSIRSESDIKKLETAWKTGQPTLSRATDSTDHLSDTDVTELSGSKMRISESGNPLDYTQPFYTSEGSMYFMPSQRAKCSSNGSVNFTPNHASTPYKATTEKLEENANTKCAKSNCCGSNALFDWSLFGNLLFVSYVFGICCGNCGYVNTFLFIPPLAKDFGLDKQKQALLLSIAGKLTKNGILNSKK